MAEKPVELLIWDMDGTLIDSATVVPDSFIAAANEFGGNRCSRDEVVALYSLGVPENVIEHLLGRAPLAEEMEFFYSTLAAKASEVAVHDGIHECLRALNGVVRMAVFTGASQRSAETLLEAVGLMSAFEQVVGGDGHPPKPDPAGLRAVAAAMQVPLERCAYAGDAPTDIQAAGAAPVRSIAVAWGHLFDRSCGADLLVETPADLASELLR